MAPSTRTSGYMTGMRGLYLTAAELARLGFVVSVTSRSARGADLLVTDQNCQRTWSVQVKTNGSTAKWWQVGPHARNVRSPSHVYVFVNIPKKKSTTILYRSHPCRC